MAMKKMTCLTQLAICLMVISATIKQATSRSARPIRPIILPIPVLKEETPKEQPLEIGFDTLSTFIPKNAVALTFDDGPDHLDHTSKCLDALKKAEVKATFFINTKNYGELQKEAKLQDVLLRIISDGHELGSHSVSHANLSQLTPDQIREQMKGVEDVVQFITNDKNRQITLFRAPFGSPYQRHNPSSPSKEYQLVAPIVRERAVHIGWAVDSFDYKCPANNPNCVFSNVKRGIRGANGIILFNSVHPQTCNALSHIIKWLQSSGYTFTTVERMVRAKFGKSSHELIYGNKVVFDNDIEAIPEDNEEIIDDTAEIGAIGDTEDVENTEDVDDAEDVGDDDDSLFDF